MIYICLPARQCVTCTCLSEGNVSILWLSVAPPLRVSDQVPEADSLVAADLWLVDEVRVMWHGVCHHLGIHLWVSTSVNTILKTSKIIVIHVETNNFYLMYICEGCCCGCMRLKLLLFLLFSEIFEESIFLIEFNGVLRHLSRALALLAADWATLSFSRASCTQHSHIRMMTVTWPAVDQTKSSHLLGIHPQRPFGLREGASAPPSRTEIALDKILPEK